MQRRRILASAALLGASALAGCSATGSESPPSPPDAPESVADWSFSSPAESVDAARDQPPAVTCDPDAERVRVVGVCPVGNACSSLYLANLTHDAGKLAVAVRGWEPNRDCGEALNIAGYRAEFAMADGLPETVRAVEPADANTEETRTTTRDC